MKLTFRADYHESRGGPGEVAVWLSAKGMVSHLFLVLPAAWKPNPHAPDDEKDVIMSTLMRVGDRLQDLLTPDPPREEEE